MMYSDKENCNSAKSKIFKTAAALFAEKGYNAVSMREISQLSGLSKPTIYYYFGSKEGIYSELIHSGIEHMDAVLVQVAKMDTPVVEKLKKVARIYFKSCKDFPEYTRLLLNITLSTEKLEFLDNIEEHVNEKNEMGYALVQEGINKGEFKSTTDPMIVARTFSGALVHYVIHHLMDKEADLTDELADNIVDTIVCGIKK